jgi:hypothetical protein
LGYSFAHVAIIWPTFVVRTVCGTCSRFQRDISFGAGQPNCSHSLTQCCSCTTLPNDRRAASLLDAPVGLIGALESVKRRLLEEPGWVIALLLVLQVLCRLCMVAIALWSCVLSRVVFFSNRSPATSYSWQLHGARIADLLVQYSVVSSCNSCQTRPSQTHASRTATIYWLSWLPVLVAPGAPRIEKSAVGQRPVQRC